MKAVRESNVLPSLSVTASTLTQARLVRSDRKLRGPPCNDALRNRGLLPA
jgi:hypothetical protein